MLSVSPYTTYETAFRGEEQIKQTLASSVPQLPIFWFHEQELSPKCKLISLRSHPAWEMELRTFSNVSRPLCTILSAISTAGILPEKLALVYP